LRVFARCEEVVDFISTGKFGDEGRNSFLANLAVLGALAVNPSVAKALRPDRGR
jgi:hypothetical protein